jgi:hypothetical protein
MIRVELLRRPAESVTILLSVTSPPRQRQIPLSANHVGQARSLPEPAVAHSSVSPPLNLERAESLPGADASHSRSRSIFDTSKWTLACGVFFLRRKGR